MIYKYSLDNTSKKFICPNCNKKTFVKFIDNETNEYLNNTVGRCDRESKCGYFKKPSGNIITKIISNTIVSPPTYHNKEVLIKYSNSHQNSYFIKYLLKKFNHNKVLLATKRYYISTTNYWYKSTVFWQIDKFNKIRGGKIMLYDENTGKRVKKPFNHLSWMHKQLKLTNFVLKQCLFGLHLINTISKNDTICIVESEKTAIILSIVIPEFLWLATGSKTGFKEKMLLDIKKYKIIAYPDKTEYLKWNDTSKFLNKKGFRIECSNLLELINIKDGDDLVDYFKLD